MISSSKPEPKKKKKSVLVNNLCNASRDRLYVRQNERLYECWTIVESIKLWMRERCVRVCVNEWQLVHMVPEVEKHIIPLSMSSQPCRIEEPGHWVSSILFNLDVKSVREKSTDTIKSSCISIVERRPLSCGYFLFFFFFQDFSSYFSPTDHDSRWWAWPIIMFEDTTNEAKSQSNSLVTSTKNRREIRCSIL